MTELYRPSNGTEGEIFAEEWCDNCIYDDAENERYCPIFNASMAYLIDDPKYPREWIYDENGEPMCTKFEHK